jgi:nitroreductase
MNLPAERVSDHSVDPLFIGRWSPRAFTGEAIPDAILFAAFEAARWAPSSGNSQPARFLYAKTGSARWPDFLALLAPGNQVWAKHASALIIVVSKRTAERHGVPVALATHSYDAGAAWMSLALQAHLLGWQTHGIGGFDREKTRSVLNVPDNFAVEAAMAIGKRGERASLPEDLQAREAPNGRLPLREIIIEGGFPPAAAE